MIPHTVSVLQVKQRRQLKQRLVVIGLRALAQGDMARVHLITTLLRSKGLAHV